MEDARGEELVLGMLAEPLDGSSWKVWEDVQGEMLIQLRVPSADSAPHPPWARIRRSFSTQTAGAEKEGKSPGKCV